MRSCSSASSVRKSVPCYSCSDSPSSDLVVDEDADTATQNWIQGGQNSQDASGPGPFSVLSKKMIKIRMGRVYMYVDVIVLVPSSELQVGRGSPNYWVIVADDWVVVADDWVIDPDDWGCR